jgi:hypothetical protein
MKRWIFTGIIASLCLGFAGVVSAQQPGASCKDSGVVATSLNADCKIDTGVGVGLSRNQEANIIVAADIFGNRFSADDPAGVCLKGTGALFVSKASSSPRAAFFAWYYTTPEGFTCTNLSEPATVILVQGSSPFAPGQSPSVSPTSDAADGTSATTTSTTTTTTTTTTSPAAGAGGQFVLNNCTVVTRAILNFRDAPSISSNVIDLIPYRTILKAINRNDAWFNVIFGDRNGWVAASLVNTRGKCS